MDVPTSTVSFSSPFWNEGAPSLPFLQGPVSMLPMPWDFHAQRLASQLRRASPALYHLFLSSTIAMAEPSA
jgi:hypothetical protein